MNDVSARFHPHYGTCGGCHQLKHVDADGLVRDHNRYRTTGTVVSPLRCTGSGTRYLERVEPDEMSA
jgi:hypothetical protein